MLLTRRISREQKAHFPTSPVTGENWIRIRGIESSPYGSLVCFESAGRKPLPSAPQPAEYQIKIGRKIFTGNDHRKLVRLAVAARKKSASR